MSTLPHSECLGKEFPGKIHLAGLDLKLILLQALQFPFFQQEMGELIIPWLSLAGGTLDLRSLRSDFGFLWIKGIQNFSVLESGADISGDLLVPGLNWEKIPFFARVKLGKIPFEWKG